jgi:hypothetical protein
MPKGIKGYAFAYTEKFVEHLVSIFTAGGALNVEPIFERQKLMKELCNESPQLGINIDQSKVKRHQVELESALTDLLDGVSLMIKDRRVKTCRFEKLNDNGKEVLGLVIETDGSVQGVMKLPSSVRLAFPVF